MANNKKHPLHLPETWKKPQGDVTLAEVEKFFEEDLQDNIEGGVKITIPTVRILHQAAQYEFHSSSGDRTETSFQGILIHQQHVKGYWRSGSEEIRPDCSSLDGLKPSPNTENPLSPICATCEKNQFGSAENGSSKGKACKDMIRVHILINGGEIPTRLMIPPTSLRRYEDYISQLTVEKLPKNAVRTKFALERKQEGANTWSLIVLENAGTVTPDEYLLARSLRDRFIAQMSQQEIQGHDLDTEPEEDKELPF